MLILDFYLDGTYQQVPGFFSLPLHVNVVESNPYCSPKRFRVAFSFANLPAPSLQILESIFAQVCNEHPPF